MLQGKGSPGALSLAARLGAFCPLLMWPGPFHGGLRGGTCRQTRGVLPPRVQALSLFPLSQADKERHFPSYLVFSSWIYLFILLPSWDLFFFNFYFSHAYLKTAFQASWGLVGCVTSSAVGIPLCSPPPPPSPWHPLLLAPTAAFCAGTVTGLSVIVFCMRSMKPGVLSPQYRKEIKKKAQIYGRRRMNTFIT